jgi:hypothetical protein
LPPLGIEPRLVGIPIRKPGHYTDVHLSAPKNENFSRRNIPKSKQRETSFSDWAWGLGASGCLVRISVVVAGHDGIDDHLTRAGAGACHRDAQGVVRNQRAASLTTTDIRPFDWNRTRCSVFVGTDASTDVVTWEWEGQFAKTKSEGKQIFREV